MAETEAYRDWLAGGNASVALIETLEVQHVSFGSMNLANWDQNINCTTETGAVLTFFASRFYMEPAEVSDSTSQGTVITMSSLDGLFYSAIKAMTIEERQQPITATYRSYLLSDLTRPLINPPPKWTCHAIEATLEAIRAEIRAEPLRVRKVGLYYTTREFPVLVHV